MGMDRRIGSQFLNPGIGFGGFCFPKDLSAFVRIAEKHGYDFDILKAAERVNNDQRKHFVKKVKDSLWNLRDKTVGVLGLAFKPNTDDMRFAPSIEIIEELQAAGARVRAFDPHAMGKAKGLIKDVEFCKDAYDVCKGSDCLAILTEWSEFKEMDLKKVKKLLRQPVIVDGREMLVPVSDTIRSYQTQAAADARLAQAKAILEQARNIQQQAAQPPQQTEFRQEAHSERSNAPTSRQLPDNAAELAEKIQMGSPEEVIAALQQLTDSASRRESGLDDTTRVLSVLEDQKARETVDTFAQANPELTTDPLFQTITASFIEQEQLRDLHAAGYTVDQVKTALAKPNGLAELHRYARAQRFPGVRGVDKLLTAAHQQAVQWRTGAPAQQQTTRQIAAPAHTSPATREQRKEMLQSQPLARRMSPQATAAQQQPRSQEASRQAGFDQIRAARGLPSQKR
jgi:hypothetical protein